jgi:hypothetical protein
MADSFASLIVGEGDFATKTPLSKQQYYDLLQNGMDYVENDSSTEKLKRVHIVFLPYYVFTRHYPPSPCNPVPVFIVLGRTPFLYQGCISGQRLN